ncbi:MAG: SpoIID/LytB domain-containing protein [Lachnospiraceae bacterium]|nr:SpoIID/LytB domain-containing protein [Lachnospiraceae bacterium]
MKTGYKILIIIAAILVVIGITGTVLIHRLLLPVDEIPDTYYTCEEASYLLNCMTDDPLQTSEGNDPEAGFTAADAGLALKYYLELNDDQLEEMIQTAGQQENSALSFLYKKKDSSVLSAEEFRHFYEYLMDNIDQPGVRIESLLVLNISDPGVEEVYVISPDGRYSIAAFSEIRTGQLYAEISDAVDSCIRVYMHGDQIIEYTGLSEEPVELMNVWLEGLMENGQVLNVFLNGYHKVYTCRMPEDQAVQASSVKGKLADLKLVKGSVTDIIIKSDIITSKVLAVSDDGVELENYGKLSLSEYYKIYKIYGELAVEPTSRILVGYNSTNFVIADGVIEAALITEPIKAENIRVALRNSDYSSLAHDKVIITSDAPFSLTFQDQEKLFEAGEELELTPSGGYMADGRVFIRSTVENGTLKLLSVTRNKDHPSYRGTLEVAPYDENSLLIVNELSLEEYLYAVVPSEMPVSYGNEALKVQAICARGYAYMKMQDGSYAQYGAHLDDSTMTQVYHSVDETEESILAVKETYGMVPVYDSQVIQAYFFSTSCGTTCNNQDVWGGEVLPYLQDTLEADDPGNNIQTPEPVDLSSEEDFQTFIRQESGHDMFETEFPFYRWNVEFSQEALSNTVNSNLQSRYEADPDRILTLQSDGTYSSRPIASIGDIQSIEITERGKSGIVKEMQLNGTLATIRVKGQTNARSLMSPADTEIHRQDDSVSVGWAMLPSPFYYVEQQPDGHYLIYGGGYGHGVGMSQNGAKALADRGYSAEEIISHYYNGVDLVNIYR